MTYVKQSFFSSALSKNAGTAFLALALAAFFVFALFAWQGRKGFQLEDEGFLWYGAKRVLAGEVPIRDFQSYDPGRYYWSAALMKLWGRDGIMALRGAAAVFQTMGLFAALLLLARAVESTMKRKALYLCLSALILAVWMFPRHKVFDISLSIISVVILSYLVRKPTLRRFFLSGLGLGLIAVFGRNHGLYGFVGGLGVMAWLSYKRAGGPGFLKRFALWTAGVAAGYSPMILLALFARGFAAAFWDGIRFLFEFKATNLSLPVPWPWRVDFASLEVGDAVREVLVGVFYVFLIVFGVLSVVWMFRWKAKNQSAPPGLVAAAFMVLPYAHVAFSRADAGHLSQSIFPLLIGCLVLLSWLPAKGRRFLSLALCAASVWVMCVNHPGWQYRAGSPGADMEISGSLLRMHPNTASDIRLLRELIGEYAPNGQSFLAAPFWPGAYALFDRRSPTWEIYALFPRSAAFEKAEIERIEAACPRFAIIIDLPIDGRDELRYRHTHPKIHRYIQDNFEPVPHSLHPSVQIYALRRH